VDVTEEDDLAEEDEIGALEGAFVFVNWVRSFWKEAP
jgi:hypothetical protein